MHTSDNVSINYEFSKVLKIDDSKIDYGLSIIEDEHFKQGSMDFGFVSKLQLKIVMITSKCLNGQSLSMQSSTMTNVEDEHRRS